MRSFYEVLLYPRLAGTGILKNRRTYLPYILTCSGMVMMYYIISFLSESDYVGTMKGGNILQAYLGLGCGVMVIFSAIFLFYTNSFLIRRRKTEFGLYNILGMGKRNIAVILIWETVFIYIFSLAAGLACGVLFSKLAELLLAKMLADTASAVFSVEVMPMLRAAVFYAVIFLLIMLNSLRQISLSKPVELMKSENFGEKPPRANYFLAIMGVVLLAAAYCIAIFTENPSMAVFLFFVAVILVVIATYLLFISGSVALCRLLQKNKIYYYKTNHFISVSQMAYRMKRNGAGLASICILSTMVLVTLSSTACLYIGEEDMLKNRYQRDVAVNSFTIDENVCALTKSTVDSVLQRYGEKPVDPLDYRYLEISGVFRGDSVTVDSSRADELYGSGEFDLRQMFIVPVSDYNRLSGENIVLAENETAVYTVGEDYAFDRINIEEYGVFNVIGTNENLSYIGESRMTNISEISLYPTMFLLVSGEDILYKLNEVQEELYNGGYRMLHHYYGFDLSCDEEKQTAIGTEIQESVIALRNESGAEWTVKVECASKDKSEFYALYGGLFFLGILLGTVFICAAALIMYYKQISEGFEDKAKFEILQKVGMTRTEIKESINSQVLTVFFAPLIAAGVHMAFAFGIISRMLALFGLVDSGLFAAVAMGCFLLFGLLYAAVYLLTSKRYYRIVSGKE
ncbi:MAG: FtsX-like permease family protein [Oscillospiraceae bacterium]